MAFLPLALLYPVAALLSLLGYWPLPVALALAIGLAGLCLLCDPATRPKGLFALLLAVLAWAWWHWGGRPEALLLPPVLVNALLCLTFAATLTPGSRPLITRLMVLVRGEMNPELARYGRQLTLAWALVFALLTLESLLLTLYAPPAVWTLMVNVVNPLLVALLFVVEYRIRLRVLSHLEHPGFGVFLGRLIRVDWRRVIRP